MHKVVLLGEQPVSNAGGVGSIPSLISPLWAAGPTWYDTWLAPRKSGFNSPAVHFSAECAFPSDSEGSRIRLAGPVC
jgi:hypothetical protein